LGAKTPVLDTVLARSPYPAEMTATRGLSAPVIISDLADLLHAVAAPLPPNMLVLKAAG